MARIFTIANQKGGVGKTTTVAALGAAFAVEGKRVLVVDLDPHAGLTVSLGFEPDSFEKTIYHGLLSEVDLKEIIRSTKLPNMGLIPANLDLAATEAELIGQIGWDRTLKDAIEPIEQEYDFIFFDCPPSLGVLTTNALVASHAVIVPLQCEYLALRALKQFEKIIAMVKKKANPNLQVRLLRTMYDSRTLHSREAAEEIARIGGDQVFTTIIKRTVKFADSTIAGEPILTYAQGSEAAQAYRELAKEV